MEGKMRGFQRRVSIRNLLKTKVQEYQLDTVSVGVPKGTNQPVFEVITSNLNKQQEKPKTLIFHRKCSVFMVDITGHDWTQKEALGFRKGFESPLQGRSEKPLKTSINHNIGSLENKL